MDVGTNDFLAREFVFENIPLVDALKYLAAFNNAVWTSPAINLFASLSGRRCR
jgi:hypothetical protein